MICGFVCCDDLAVVVEHAGLPKLHACDRQSLTFQAGVVLPLEGQDKPWLVLFGSTILASLGAILKPALAALNYITPGVKHQAPKPLKRNP